MSQHSGAGPSGGTGTETNQGTGNGTSLKDAAILDVSQPVSRAKTLPYCTPSKIRSENNTQMNRFDLGRRKLSENNNDVVECSKSEIKSENGSKDAKIENKSENCVNSSQNSESKSESGTTAETADMGALKPEELDLLAKMEEANRLEMVHDYSSRYMYILPSAN